MKLTESLIEIHRVNNGFIITMNGNYKEVAMDKTGVGSFFSRILTNSIDNLGVNKTVSIKIIAELQAEED